MKLVLIGVIILSPTLAIAQNVEPRAIVNELLQQQIITMRKQHEIEQLRLGQELRKLRRERSAQIEAARRQQEVSTALDFGADDPVIGPSPRSPKHELLCETISIDRGLSASHCHEP